MGRQLRVVAISDTHTRHERLRVPEGDVLVHAGDFTRRGELESVRRLDAYLGRQPHRLKVVVAGNHDFCFERIPAEARALITQAVYLEDSGCAFEGLKIWGSPWQPEFFDWAFNLPRGEALRERWALIPDDTDLLVTHGPPRGRGDRTVRGEAVGCEELLAAVRRVRPAVHVFGHIHEGYGVVQEANTLFVNASICTVRYAPTQAPIVIDLERRGARWSVVGWGSHEEG